MTYDFLKLPRWIMNIPTLNLSECVVLAVLLNAEQVYGSEFFLKYEEIAEMSKLSLRQAKTIIKRLEELGMIMTKRSKRMHYELVWNCLNQYKNNEPQMIVTEAVEEVIDTVTNDVDKTMEVIDNEIPTPDTDRYDFNCWVIDQAKNKLNRWTVMFMNRNDRYATTEIIGFCDDLSDRYFNGQYKKDIRLVIARRVRNAS